MQKYSHFIWSELSARSWLTCFTCLYACNNIQSVPDIFESKIGIGWQWPKRLIYHITNSQYLCLFAAMWVYACILTAVWVHAGLCESGCVGRAVAVRRRWRWCWRWAMESSADPGVHTDTPRPPQRPLSVRARGRVCRDTERENSLTHTHTYSLALTRTNTGTYTHLEVCMCPWRFDRWATAAWMATAQPSFSHCVAPAQPEQLLSEHLKERDPVFIHTYTVHHAEKLLKFLYVCVE